MDVSPKKALVQFFNFYTGLLMQRFHEVSRMGTCLVRPLIDTDKMEGDILVLFCGLSIAPMEIFLPTPLGVGVETQIKAGCGSEEKLGAELSSPQS